MFLSYLTIPILACIYLLILSKSTCNLLYFHLFCFSVEVVTMNFYYTVHDILKSLVRMVSTERDRLKQALEQNVMAQNNSNNINSLKESMAEVS